MRAGPLGADTGCGDADPGRDPKMSSKTGKASCADKDPLPPGPPGAAVPVVIKMRRATMPTAAGESSPRSFPAALTGDACAAVGAAGHADSRSAAGADSRSAAG